MTKTERRAGWHRHLSLKGLLLLLLLPGMLLSLAFDSYNDYQTLTEITRGAHDQALLHPVRLLERSIDFDEEGNVSVRTPWFAWQLLESQPDEIIYYRVQLLQGDPLENDQAALEGSTTLLGMKSLPDPPNWHEVAAASVAFYDAKLADDIPVRTAAQLRRLVHDGETTYVLVQVAQRSARRLEAESLAWKQEWKRDLRAAGVVALLLWLGVSWGVRPLTRLRREIESRSPSDTTPLDTSAVPSEVVPLVQAVNGHIARHNSMIAEQSRFLADASHQMRTPLAIMLTQAEYALRESDPELVRESLRALVDRLGVTRRLTEQLLNLAMAQHDTTGRTGSVFDLQACARGVLLDHLPLAETENVDLGWDDSADQGLDLLAYGHPDGIREAIGNLVHNAIHYTSRGGRVTLSAGRTDSSIWVAVSDNGPGILPEHRKKALQRFVRFASQAGQQAANREGAGLGLAIAQAFAQRDGGYIELCDGEPNADGAVGLKAVLHLPGLSENTSIA